MNLFGRRSKPELSVSSLIKPSQWMGSHLHLSNAQPGESACKLWSDIIRALLPPDHRIGVVVQGGAEERRTWPELDQVIAPHLKDRSFIPDCQDWKFLEQLSNLIPAYDTQSLGFFALFVYQNERIDLNVTQEVLTGQRCYNTEEEIYRFLNQFRCVLYSTEDDPYLFIESVDLTPTQLYATLHEVTLRHAVKLTLRESYGDVLSICQCRDQSTT